MRLEKETTFTENFIKANGLSGNEFNEWLLTSGMLFEATDIWWGNQNKRKSQHEGVDLGFYRSRDQKVAGFDESTKISAIVDAVVVRVFNDFLGKSVFMKHKIMDVENRELCSIFGHISPDSDLCPGKILKEGEIIGRIAGVGKASLRPHLHITMGWVEKKIDDDVFDWDVIGKTDVLKLIDPIEIIGRYSMVPTSTILPDNGGS